MGFTWSDQIHHIPFGLMSLNEEDVYPEGNIIQLEDVLNDSISWPANKSKKRTRLANADQVAEEVGLAP